MSSLPLANIRLIDPFWSRWQDTIAQTTLPAIYEQIVETGGIENFLRVARNETGGFQGLWFNDSDVYKYLEACAYSLVHRENQDLRASIETCISAIAGAQSADGYINTFIQLGHPNLRFRNLHMMHEMYCGGHLIEAAVAVHENLGDSRLLKIAERFVGHLVSVFGPDSRLGYCGHEEIELALVRLARCTGKPEYREFSRWMVEQRGQRPSPFESEFADEQAMLLSPWSQAESPYVGEYSQDHAPIRKHSQVVGHAVRAMYLYVAATDLADGLGDSDLEAALERTWQNLTRRRMYITGGVGPSSRNEGFTEDFDLPNLTAYAETCAACGLVFWGKTMLEMTANSEYADVVERSLYNGALAGISLKGDRFFYTNPLESRGIEERPKWYKCACCPPNVTRLIANLGAYVVGASDDQFFIHIPAGIKASLVLNGVATEIEVVSDYPWSGEIQIHIRPQSPVKFGLNIRIPEWCDDVSMDLVNGDEEAAYESGYARFTRQWIQNDLLKVDFGMEPKWIESDPRVLDNLGRVALCRGPIVYTAESIDTGYQPQRLIVDTESVIAESREASLENAVALTLAGVRDEGEVTESLYADAGTTGVTAAEAKLIPYFAWNNRGRCHMQVWHRSL